MRKPRSSDDRVMTKRKSWKAPIIIIAALALTLAVFVLAYSLVRWKIGDLTGMKLNEYGDAIAGVFAAVGVIWVVAGFLLQAVELNANTTAVTAANDIRERELDIGRREYRSSVLRSLIVPEWVRLNSPAKCFIAQFERDTMVSDLLPISLMPDGCDWGTAIEVGSNWTFGIPRLTPCEFWSLVQTAAGDFLVFHTRVTTERMAAAGKFVFVNDQEDRDALGDLVSHFPFERLEAGRKLILQQAVGVVHASNLFRFVNGSVRESS